MQKMQKNAKKKMQRKKRKEKREVSGRISLDLIFRYSLTSEIK